MAFASPEEILKELPLDEGDHVADFGAGSGAYAIIASKRVGSSGRVYAIDVNKELLAKVKNDAAKSGVHNLEIIWGNVENPNGSKLAPSAVDRVIISNMLFQAEDKEGVVKEAGRILKPSGLALVVDWSGSYGGLGPKENDILKPAEVRKMFLNASFAEVKEVRAGEYHYGIIFRRL